MSENNKIPYYFETPIPKYFRETGWFDNINSILFITWAFARCSTEKRTIVHDHKEITLEAYEFITGLGKSSKESHLSEDAFKHQLKTLQKAGLLKKTPNSTPNRFSCYIWVWSRFSKPNTQLNAQLTPNSHPTEHPQSRRKKTRSKESHPSIPSKESDGLDDSFKKVDLFEHSILVNKEIKTISMPLPMLEECIAIKGSKEKVIEAIEFIMRSSGRKKEISNWANAMRTWDIKPSIKPRLQENEEMAKRLERDYSESAHGWTCRIYRDTIKDVRGLLFESRGAISKTIFVIFTDPEFKEKCTQAIRENKMQKSRIPKT